MTLRAIILGCGSSGGTPRPGGPGGGGQWGALDPAEPKNIRMRCSLMVQRAHPESGWEDVNALTNVLVDTSPDLARQLLMARTGRLDAVFYTHDHADQCHGIDDLRAVALNMQHRVPVYIDESISPDIVPRFSYCFEQAHDSGYPAILDRRDMPAMGEDAIINGPAGPIAVKPFRQVHGRIDSLGFIFALPDIYDCGRIAYSSDTNDLPAESFAMLGSIDVWIVDALKREPHPSHSHLAQSLDWLAHVNAARGVLTNMHLDMDYATLCAELPAHIRPAFDGMVVEA